MRNLGLINQRGCGSGILPQQFETWVQNLQQNQSQNKNVGGQNSTMSVFNIPVIVHVIHNNEAVNILSATSGNNLNAAQIQDQINILNKDFNGTNPDTASIPAVFKPYLGKCQFNFCLAVVNATGAILAEPGIDRINRVSKGWTAPPYSTSYIDATIKPNSIWDPNRYMNMWVCPISGGILGYATFPNPGTSGLSGLTGPYGSATTDGLVMLNTAFGSIGTAVAGAPYNLGRTATHEIGHWVGLRHIWGDGTCLTDYCNDTPPAQTNNFGCPTFPYKLGTCAGNTTGEMTMNYMDYTDDACMYMFSIDQKNRAQLIMTNSTMRATLLTSTVCNLPSIGNDIGIVSVASPTYSQVIICSNKINPILNVTNFGSTIINSAVFNYSVNGMALQTYSWSGTLNPSSSNTIALPQISNITNGLKVFSVTVTSPNGGTDNNLSNNGNMQNFSITGSFTLSATAATICAGSSTTLTASGGASTYTWNPGAITSTQAVYSPTATTNYTLSGSSGTCINTATTSITVGGGLSVTITPPSSTVCSGSSVTLTVSGATTYTWNTGLNATSIVVSPTATSIYTVTGKTGLCTGVKTATVNIIGTPTVVVTTATICTGNIATLTASGAASYTWNPGGLTGTSVAFSPTATTIYTVTGANGSCVGTKSTNINVNGLPVINISPALADICSGSSANFTGSGASTYTWSSGQNTASVSLSPTVTTIYTLSGTNLGCVGSKTAATTVTTTPNVSVNSYTICAGGSATITASGAITYSWNTGATSSAIIVSPSSLTVYTVTGFNGICSNVKTSTVTIGTALSVIITPSNPSVCAGTSATLTASGATTYSWNTGSSLSSIVVTPLIVTTYTVLGNSGACSGTKSVTVILNSNPNTVLTATQVSCFGGSNGAVLPSTTGFGPFSYTYSPSGPNGLNAGTYTTITQDANGCKSTNTSIITQPASALSGVASWTNVLCFGGANGVAAVNVSGGTAGYSYTWSPLGGNSSTATGLTAGSYTVTITDANNCVTSSNATITQPPALNAVVTASNTSCASSCNGLATVNASGGTSAYSYTVLPTGGNAANASSLCAGTYTYLVKDANNCTTNSVFTVSSGTGGLIVTSTSTNASCGTCTDGIASASSSGTSPFTYMWMPGMQTSQTVNSVAPGCYSITITDAIGCSGTTTTCVSFVTGITNNINATGIKLIPNPTTGEFVIETNILSQKQIDIVDVTGRVISTKQTILSNVSVNINEFASGIYYARITSDKVVTVLKIIKN